jgi:hypothetical protein
VCVCVCLGRLCNYLEQHNGHEHQKADPCNSIVSQRSLPVRFKRVERSFPTQYSVHVQFTGCGSIKIPGIKTRMFIPCRVRPTGTHQLLLVPYVQCPLCRDHTVQKSMRGRVSKSSDQTLFSYIVYSTRYNYTVPRTRGQLYIFTPQYMYFAIQLH